MPFLHSKPPPAWEIYAQELGGRGYGYPMWYADPGGKYGHIQLGDIGYLQRGRFHLLFNCTRPRDDESHKRRGERLPDQFEPFLYDENSVQGPLLSITNPELHTHSRSKSEVTGELGGGPTGAAAMGGVTHKSAEYSRASLRLHPPAERTFLDCRGDIEQYMAKHCSTWLKSFKGLKLAQKDILFVYGYTTTTVWKTSAWGRRRNEDGISLRLLGECLAGVTGRIGCLGQTSHSVSPITNKGPKGRKFKDGGRYRPDQCIFLDFGKTKSRYVVAIRAKTGMQRLKSLLRLLCCIPVTPPAATFEQDVKLGAPPSGVLPIGTAEQHSMPILSPPVGRSEEQLSAPTSPLPSPPPAVISEQQSLTPGLPPLAAASEQHATTSAPPSGSPPAETADPASQPTSSAVPPAAVVEERPSSESLPPTVTTDAVTTDRAAPSNLPATAATIEQPVVMVGSASPSNPPPTEIAESEQLPAPSSPPLASEQHAGTISSPSVARASATRETRRLRRRRPDIRQFDPTNDLLDYILRHSTVNIAYVSYEDLYPLCVDGRLPEDIIAAAEARLLPVVVIGGVSRIDPSAHIPGVSGSPLPGAIAMDPEVESKDDSPPAGPGALSQQDIRVTDESPGVVEANPVSAPADTVSRADSTPNSDNVVRDEAADVATPSASALTQGNTETTDESPVPVEAHPLMVPASTMSGPSFGPLHPDVLDSASTSSKDVIGPRKSGNTATPPILVDEGLSTADEKPALLRIPTVAAPVGLDSVHTSPPVRPDDPVAAASEDIVGPSASENITSAAAAEQHALPTADEISAAMAETVIVTEVEMSRQSSTSVHPDSSTNSESEDSGVFDRSQDNWHVSMIDEETPERRKVAMVTQKRVQDRRGISPRGPSQIRLLSTDRAELTYFHSGPPAVYAVISYATAGDSASDEMSFKDIQAVQEKYAETDVNPLDHVSSKVRSACRLAGSHGIEWIWIDFACVDRDNSTELSQAINQMHDIYAQSTVCYAFLEDVPTDSLQNLNHALSPFALSVWHLLSWTLQALLVPEFVVFVSNSWDVLGTKSDFAETLEAFTAIPVPVLRSEQPLSEICIGRRLSWAAKRETARVEDEAYSLLGILGVNIPILYGEGRTAFVRLQEEVMRHTPDTTLFAWGKVYRRDVPGRHVAFEEHGSDHLPDSSLLAASLYRFAEHSSTGDMQLIYGLRPKYLPPGDLRFAPTPSGILAHIPILKLRAGLALGLLPGAYTSRNHPVALLLTRCTTSVGSKIATYDIGARPIHGTSASEDVCRLVCLDPGFTTTLISEMLKPFDRLLWAIGMKRFAWQSIYLRLTP